MQDIQLPASQMQGQANLQQHLEQFRPQHQSVAEVSLSGATTHSPDTSVSAITEQPFIPLNPHQRHQHPKRSWSPVGGSSAHFFQGMSS